MKGDEPGVMIGGSEGDRRWWFTDETCFEAKPVGSMEELDLRLLAAGFERAAKWERDSFFQKVDGWDLKRIQS